MSYWTVGIDPGATGAIAILDGAGYLCHVIDMPYEGGEVLGAQVAEILNDLLDPREIPSNQVTVWIEKVGPMPKQGIASTWKFAQGYGTLLGVCEGLAVRTKRVTPATWKRAMHVTKDKGTSRRLAVEHWPNDLHLFKRVKDDGRAEAALIALYGYEQAHR